ncbi:MAG: efflux RND transporter periplasmic adaptor subunit [Myxococcota bacterium]
MSIAKSKLAWIVAALVLAGAGVTYLLVSSDETVETVNIDRREIVELYVATGKLEARHTSDIGPEVGGIVDTLEVTAGDRVQHGQVLAELRPRDAKIAIDKAAARVQTLEDELRQARSGPTDAEIDAAKARVSGAKSQLEQAEREVDRAERLHSQGLVTDAELDQKRTAVEQAESNLASARAEIERLRELPHPEGVRVARSRLEQARLDLEEARTNLDKTTLRAPFAGLVLDVDADPGERAGPGQTVVRVADMDTTEVYAEIDEDYFGRLQKGQSATLIFPSMPDETFSATLRQIGPEIDSARGIIGVHLDPADLPDKAFPGLTVDVNIEVARLPDATAVPQEAVLDDGEQTYVLTVEDGVATRTPVTIEARGESWTAIRADQQALSPNTPIILRAAKIEPGTHVEVTRGDSP